MHKIALIPSYEPESETLINLAEETTCAGFELVVVDDGSGEKYKEIFDIIADYGTVITSTENYGKGHALKLGLEFIKEKYNQCVVVTLDGDGQHSVNDALKICEKAEEQPDSLIIGSRKLRKTDPIKSRFGNSITRKVYKMSTGVDVYDTQSGLRAFSYRLLDKMLEIPGERYEYEMNVLLDMAREKIPMVEIPIEVIYFDKNNSVSHFDAVKDSIKIYKEIFKFIGSSFAGFLVDYGMYAVFTTILKGITGYYIIANVLARFVSATVNFNINRKLVFKSEGNFFREAARYACLAVAVIIVNSFILSILAGAGVNIYFAKIIVEIVMFVLNYLVQHFIIFNHSNKNDRNNKPEDKISGKTVNPTVGKRFERIL